MEFSLYSKGYLEFNSGLPSNYHGDILNSSNAFHAKSNLTEVVIQVLNGEGYSIRFIIGKFLKSLCSDDWILSKGLYSLFMLKNSAFKSIGNIGRFHLRQDQYTCFISSANECKATFDKTNEFKLLEFYYSPELLEEMIPYFPDLKYKFSLNSIFLSDQKYWTLPTMKEIYTQILNCPYDESTRQLYFDLKVREMLFQLLEKAFQKKVKSRFTAYETARINDAKNILEDYIDKKPPSIKSLSKKVAINENKLKIGFKYLFGSGIFEWLMDRKMNYAKSLIVSTNKPIKEIAASVGYPRTTNFITSFRRKFGMTPGSLRR